MKMLANFSMFVLYKLSSRPIINFVIFYFFLSMGILTYLSFDIRTLDSMFSYSTKYALDFVWNLSYEERVNYIRINLADLSFAISYILFSAVLLFKIYSPLNPKPGVYIYLLILPLFVGSFDMAETMSIFLLNNLANTEAFIGTGFARILGQTCSIATPVKWLSSLVLLFTYLFGLAWSTAESRKNRNSD